MYRKHKEEDRLRYMKMLEDGYSINYLHNHYGINRDLLKSLWEKYRKEGPLGLLKKKNISADGHLRERIVKDIEENGLTLCDASLKYDVSASRLSIWLKLYREKGPAVLHKIKPRGRPLKDMGRPRKKKPEEMTELERLRYENERLRAENALLKKVRALVEEREARLHRIGQKPSRN